MPRSEEEQGDGFNATITEMLNTFIAQWGDTTRRLQESSEDRLDRVNKMAEALCDAVERTSQMASAHGGICRLSLAAAEERREVTRLTDLTVAMQRLFEEVVRELARQGGNTTTIGNLSGKTI